MNKAIDISARQVGSGTWEVSLPAKKSSVRTKAKLRPRHVVHADSKEAAIAIGHEKFAREILAYQMGVSMSLADLAVYFIDCAAATGHYKKETATDYRNMIMRYVAPYMSLDADKIATRDIEALYAHLLEHGACRGGGIDASTICKLNTVLRAVYDFLVREGVVSVNPMATVVHAPRSRSRMRALSEREFSSLMAALDDELTKNAKDRAGIIRRNCAFGAWLDVHIGARVGEICAIQRGKISLYDEKLLIDGSISEKGGLHRGPPKTAQGYRSVSLDKSVVFGFQEHFEWQQNYLTKRQQKSESTPLCANAKGGFIRPSVMSSFFKELCIESGIELAKGESFHVLRHTHATHLLSSSVNPEAVRTRLGHARIETTFRYGHVMSGEDKTTSEHYGEIVRGIRIAGAKR